ncbi:MAG: MFS transporter [Bacteroidales bacterium]|nr:MFS transporter [Bacteroidales bacterium]
MAEQQKKGVFVAVIAMMFLFAMISFVTNMAAPFGQIWKIQYEWAGMMGNMMNFAAYLFMGIPAGIMITKIGYKKTALVALVLGFTGVLVQYISSTLDGNAISTYIVYLLGAFICGFCVCILNTVVNPMLNLLGGGGNKGNQFIQIGGSLNSLAGTFTPLLVGAMIGQVTKSTSMGDVSPLLMIAMAIFAGAFVIIFFTKITEPEQAEGDIMSMVKGALGYRHLVLGIIAIFFYVGVEVGIPGEMIFYLSKPVAEGGVLGSAAIAGTVAAIYWFLMLVGRLTSSFISDKVSSRTQIVTVCSIALGLLLAAIFIPESVTFSLPGSAEAPADFVLFTFTGGQLPVKCLFFVLCGLCTSVMWGGIFNLATEGLGKYTAAASGLFMTMVVGGGVMPLLQDMLAGVVGFINSYWIVVAMVAYMLFYGLVGSKPAKK